MKDFFDYDAKIVVREKEYTLSRNRLMVILAKSPAWISQDQPPEKLCIKLFEKIEKVFGEEILFDESRLLTARILGLHEDQLAELLQTYDANEKIRRKEEKRAKEEAQSQQGHKQTGLTKSRAQLDQPANLVKPSTRRAKRRYVPRKPQPKPVVQKPGPAEIEAAFVQWRAFERKSILLESNFIADDELPIGETKIGGKADMPAGSNYPLGSNGLAMSLVAQLNLKEVDAIIADVFPVNKGLLSFFALSEADNYHLEKKRYEVRYVADTTNLERKDYPKDLNPHDSMQCMLSLSATVPYEGWPGVEALFDLAGQDFDKFDEHMDHYSTCRRSSIFGYGQTETSLEAKLAEGEEYSLENLIPLFRLVRQYDRDKGFKAGYGDIGSLAFYIRKNDLQAMRFDKVIVEFHSS